MTEELYAECGEPAEYSDLNARGPGQAETYCRPCFFYGRGPHTDSGGFQTFVEGEVAQVVTILETDVCGCCGVTVLDNYVHGKELWP